MRVCVRACVRQTGFTARGGKGGGGHIYDEISAIIPHAAVFVIAHPERSRNVPDSFVCI